LSGALGFVLAGGASRRMGRDKALLEWHGRSLLDHALARLRQVCDEVFVLCGPVPRHEGHGAPLLLDAQAGQGPLAGLLAGLERLDHRPGLFLAVDVPRVPAELLGFLLNALAGHDAAVPVTAAGPEPLVAAYTRRCLEPVRRRLEAGERRLTDFWPDVDVRRLGEGELRRFGPPELIFANLNAPEDWAD
jgi:molybdopterin-guanine dinucleotide biosynthesis protein A